MNQSSESTKPAGLCWKPRRYSSFSSATSEVRIWPAGLLSSKSLKTFRDFVFKLEKV